MVDVSVIIPVYNASQWIANTLESILQQTFTGSLEVSIYDDASTDTSMNIIDSYRTTFQAKDILMIIGVNKTREPYGVGYTRNQAIRQSNGRYICFLDADDVLLPDRIHLQYEIATTTHPYTLVGGRYIREPEDSTYRYTKWANSLTPLQLYTQAFTSFGPTLIIPTWFMSRELFEKYGPFDETGTGTPEDLIFFYKLIKDGDRVSLVTVDQPVVLYRYHPLNTTLSIKEETIWRLRVQALQEVVLSKWTSFTIWNAGKQGKRLYRSLEEENRKKVMCFCDVDKKKIDKGLYTFEESEEPVKPRVPIVHFKDARPPFILCVKWELTKGEFETNLSSLALREGIDYYNFS